MCGRFRLTPRAAKLAERFGFEPEDDWVPPTISHQLRMSSSSVSTLRNPSDRFQMRWGLIPFWAKDASIGYKMMNARAETVASILRDALQSRFPVACLSNKKHQGK